MNMRKELEGRPLHEQFDVVRDLLDERAILDVREAIDIIEEEVMTIIQGREVEDNVRRAR